MEVAAAATLECAAMAVLVTAGFLVTTAIIVVYIGMLWIRDGVDSG